MHKFAPRVLSLLGALILLLTGNAFALVQRNPSTLDPLLIAQLSNASPNDRLLVFVHSADARSATKAVNASGLTLVEVFGKVGVAVAVGTPSKIKRVGTQSAVTRVEADRPIEFFMQTSHIATRGQDALDGFSTTTTTPVTNKKGKPKGKQTQTSTVTSAPVDGSGVSIAIVDSGIDGTHPMFKPEGQPSKVLRNMKLAPCGVKLNPSADLSPDVPPLPCLAGSSFREGDVWVENAATQDSDTPSMGGHGTHVAGIAGGATVEKTNGKPIHGAAPGAKLIGLSVGQTLSVYGGDSGLNWVLEHHQAPCGEDVDPAICPPIKVVNNSYGPVGGGEFDREDSTSKLQDALVREGVTVVWAAGNDGGDGSENATNPPGASPTPGILSVANYDDQNSGTRDGSLNSSSSRGLANWPDTYPDVSAPGTAITSACKPTLPICASEDTLEDPRFGTISGTSMAAPHITGIVAQLIEAGRQSLGRDLTPGEIEDLLEDNAYKFEFANGGRYVEDPRNTDNTTSFDKGHGLVDVKKTVAEIRGMSLGAEAGPTKAPVSCSQGGSAVLDPTGDTYLVKLLSPVEQDVPPYEPGLDITEGTVTWDSANQSLTGQIKLVDLPETEGLTTPSVAYYLSFFRGDERFFVEAARSAGGESYRFSQSIEPTLAQARLHLFDTTGSFDHVNDTVTMTITNQQLKDAGLDEFATGEVLNTVSFASRVGVPTDVTTLGVTAADSTLDPCQFVVGQGLRPVPPPPVPPPNGTIGVGQEYSWSAGPFTRTAPFNLNTIIFGDQCDGQPDEDDFCDYEFLQVNVPNEGGILTVTISSPDENADFDLFVYGPDGELVGNSAKGGTPPEEVSAAVKRAGVYTIGVDPYDTNNASYSGVVRLDSHATPPSLSGDGHIYHAGLVDPSEFVGSAAAAGTPVSLSVRNLHSEDRSVELSMDSDGNANFTARHQVTKDGQVVFGPFEATPGSDLGGFRTDNNWDIPADAAPGTYVFEAYVTVGGTTYKVATLQFDIF